MLDRANCLFSSPDLFSKEYYDLRKMFLKLKYPEKIIDSIFTGLKVYFWLWEHLCDQVQIFRRTAEILGAELKILGAQLQIFGAHSPKEYPKRATQALCCNIGLL